MERRGKYSNALPQSRGRSQTWRYTTQRMKQWWKECIHCSNPNSHNMIHLIRKDQMFRRGLPQASLLLVDEIESQSGMCWLWRHDWCMDIPSSFSTLCRWCDSQVWCNQEVGRFEMAEHILEILPHSAYMLKPSWFNPTAWTCSMRCGHAAKTWEGNGCVEERDNGGRNVVVGNRIFCPLIISLGHFLQLSGKSFSCPTCAHKSPQVLQQQQHL